jgi:hypothetical protein
MEASLDARIVNQEDAWELLGGRRALWYVKNNHLFTDSSLSGRREIPSGEKNDYSIDWLRAADSQGTVHAQQLPKQNYKNPYLTDHNSPTMNQPANNQQSPNDDGKQSPSDTGQHPTRQDSGAHGPAGNGPPNNGDQVVQRLDGSDHPSSNSQIGNHPFAAGTSFFRSRKSS